MFSLGENISYFFFGNSVLKNIKDVTASKRVPIGQESSMKSLLSAMENINVYIERK